MNNLNYEILVGLDAIADAELSAGISVMESIIHAYEKADMILENASDNADFSSYDIFQESTLFQEAAESEDGTKKESNFRKINKKTGKKENILKSILLAIPRAIKMFCNWLKKKFTKNKVDANNKAMDNVAKAASSGEIAEKAPSIFEELAKLPTEEMLEKAKQNASASSSAKKADDPSMDTINPPKTKLKANDAKMKKSNVTMDTVGGNDTPESIEKQYLADPDHDSKLAEYQLKYLAATGKVIFDYDLNAIDDIMNAITKFSEDSEQMLGNMPDDDAGALAVFKKHLSIITKMNTKLDTLELKSNKVYPVDLPRIQKFYKENIARFGKTSAALTALQGSMTDVADDCDFTLTHGHSELDQNSIQIMYDHVKKLAACITKISSTCQFIWAKFDTLCSSIRELDNTIKRVTHKMSKLTNKRHEMIDMANNYVQDPTSEDAKKADDYFDKYAAAKSKGWQFANDNRNLPRDQYLTKAKKELPEAFNSGTTTESYQDSEFDDEILFNEYTINEKTGQIDLNTFEKFLKNSGMTAGMISLIWGVVMSSATGSIAPLFIGAGSLAKGKLRDIAFARIARYFTVEKHAKQILFTATKYLDEETFSNPTCGNLHNHREDIHFTGLYLNIINKSFRNQFNETVCSCLSELANNYKVVEKFSQHKAKNASEIPADVKNACARISELTKRIQDAKEK